VALARIAEPPVAVLDLDLAGGDVARRLGVAVDPADAGLAGETGGRRAWERLAVDSPVGRIVAAPRRPDLAWLIRDGVCADLARAARAESATVIADIARGAGPPIELLAEAALVVVAARPSAEHLAAAGAHAAFVAGLTGSGVPVRICLSGVRLRDEPTVRLAMAAHGVRIDARLAHATAGHEAAAAAALRGLLETEAA
jgi:hypothetical protein